MTPDQLVRDELIRADRVRRLGANRRQVWRVAPWTAGACAGVAAAGRLGGWPAWVPLSLLAVGLASLSAFALAARRGHPVTDAAATELDVRARLQGELRSAFWFAVNGARDPWIEFHLARAAERVRTVDWSGLYRPPPAGRAKIATALLTAAALALAMLVPGRAGVAASSRPGASAASPERPHILVALPPDVRKQIEQMLISAESGAGRSLTAAEVRALLARLNDLARRDPARQAGSPAAGAPADKPAGKADIKAFAERARKASESTALEPDVRDALADMADKLGEADQDANAMSSRDPNDAAAATDGSGEAQPSKSGAGKGDSASAQTVKEASGGSTVGVVMMATDDGSHARDGGLGLGGGSADRSGGGHLADLGAVLKKETIDASVDNAGENVPTAERRKTEHADAATAYSHAAGAPAERGSSTAPPPVPESRRAAVKSYFIRKQ